MADTKKPRSKSTDSESLLEKVQEGIPETSSKAKKSDESSSSPKKGASPEVSESSGSQGAQKSPSPKSGKASVEESESVSQKRKPLTKDPIEEDQSSDEEIKHSIRRTRNIISDSDSDSEDENLHPGFTRKTQNEEIHDIPKRNKRISESQINPIQNFIQAGAAKDNRLKPKLTGYSPTHVRQFLTSIAEYKNSFGPTINRETIEYHSRMSTLLNTDQILWAKRKIGIYNENELCSDDKILEILRSYAKKEVEDIQDINPRLVCQKLRVVFSSNAVDAATRFEILVLKKLRTEGIPKPDLKTKEGLKIMGGIYRQALPKKLGNELHFYIENTVLPEKSYGLLFRKMEKKVRDWFLSLQGANIKMGTRLEPNYKIKSRSPGKEHNHKMVARTAMIRGKQTVSNQRKRKLQCFACQGNHHLLDCELTQPDKKIKLLVEARNSYIKNKTKQNK